MPRGRFLPTCRLLGGLPVPNKNGVLYKHKNTVLYCTKTTLTLTIPGRYSGFENSKRFGSWCWACFTSCIQVRTMWPDLRRCAAIALFSMSVPPSFSGGLMCLLIWISVVTQSFIIQYSLKTVCARLDVDSSSHFHTYLPRVQLPSSEFPDIKDLKNKR